MNKKGILVAFMLTCPVAFNVLCAQDLAKQLMEEDVNLLVGFIIVAIIGVLLIASNNRKSIQQMNVENEDAGVLGFMGVNNVPSFIKKGSYTKLKKGFDLNLENGPQQDVHHRNISTYAVQPQNFRGIAPIPKVVVEVGQSVQAGDPLFHDKIIDDVLFTAPVSGEVININRGAKRAISEIVILADKDQRYKSFGTMDLNQASPRELIELIKQSGFGAHINERPYDRLPDFSRQPDAIFVSTFSTAPLSVDYGVALNGRAQDFQTGLAALKLLSPGNVHLGLHASGSTAPSELFTDAKDVHLHWFNGKHPAGNVGIQIHHTRPINPTDKIWTINVQDVATLGYLISKGEYKPVRVISVAGNGLNSSGQYLNTFVGANISEVMRHFDYEDGKVRFISGDVLSGEKKELKQFMNIKDDQISVIPEGNYYEMLGWLNPMSSVPTISKTYPNALFPNVKYNVDTNTHGERRAFVMTGEYEKVLPMDIHLTPLMKAIMARDYERIVGLGIHELSEEDIALCEYVCTSKMPLQQILREGLDWIYEQG